MYQRSRYLIVAGIAGIIILTAGYYLIFNNDPLSLDEVEYVIYTDKDEYEIGETVYVTIQPVNPTDHDIQIPALTGSTFKFIMNGKQNEYTHTSFISQPSSTYTLHPTNKSAFIGFNLSEDCCQNITTTETGNLTIIYSLSHESELRNISKTLEIHPRFINFTDLDIYMATDSYDYLIGETVNYGIYLNNPFDYPIRFHPFSMGENVFEIDGIRRSSGGFSLNFPGPYMKLNAGQTDFSYFHVSYTPNQTGKLTYKLELFGGDDNCCNLSETVEIFPLLVSYNDLNVFLVTDKEEYELEETVYCNTRICNPLNHTVSYYSPTCFTTTAELDGLSEPRIHSIFVSPSSRYQKIEPGCPNQNFSYGTLERFTPKRPGIFTIFQSISGCGYDRTISKNVTIKYTHNLTETWSFSNLQVSKSYLSIGDYTTISFNIHNLLPYNETYCFAPLIHSPSGDYEILMSEDVMANGVQTVMHTLFPESVGTYNVSINGMTQEFTVIG